MEIIRKVLAENKKWAEKTVAEKPDFFTDLAKLQTPEILWIGCSDSRVPADKITGTQPGEIFVHRNIANLVIHTDVNLLSVLDYAVRQLHVKHIVVCGHYGCGGVGAALSNHNFDLVLNMWIRQIKDVYSLYKDELENITNPAQKTDRLVELNVIEQVKHLAKTSIVQRAWAHESLPHLHGWVYGLKDGIINPIFEMHPGDAIDPLYVYDDI
ncbi:carbonic anhydrase [Arachidicoccus sp.]|jgi:carbonic anhydrase|uniref:carbonic anhydrase n=1 Tax=Arachidicoccus sp. TaxID=1872624 RepID=UPI003D242A32